MANKYTAERNAQILISLLKAHGIKNVIASPGTTNIALVASMQIDDFFQIYSAPDERSAGYMACGLAAEKGEPVVLSCTGATASRNYYPALTEAYYRKLPILAVTSSRRSDRIGHNFDQVTDRTVLANDVAKLSVQMPIIFDEEGAWANEIAANKAILELKHKGGGPVHINLETTYNLDFTVEKLPMVRKIERYSYTDKIPKIDVDTVAIVVGAHLPWSEKLTKLVERFCECYNGIVVCDHISNYFGKYKISPNLVTMQRYYAPTVKNVDLIIHIGEVSSSEYGLKSKKVWRVSEDGELKDTFWKLENVFEMTEDYFFERYINDEMIGKTTFYSKCIEEEKMFESLIPDLPMSNAWTAMIASKKIHKNSEIHLGIRNSLRSWNLFALNDDIPCFSNTGGFGIDGSMSSVLGASLADKGKTYYCIIGDLAFFYDLNSLGNRHWGNNIRILLINNGTGMEMRFSSFYAEKIGANKDKYISASGHYGNKSDKLVKDFAEDLGMEYLSANNKSQFWENVEYFTSSDEHDRSIVFEVFVDDENENSAYEILSELKRDNKQVAKEAVINIIGDKNTKKLKSLLKRN